MRYFLALSGLWVDGMVCGLCPGSGAWRVRASPSGVCPAGGLRFGHGL